jgi:hypothetical protein
MCAVVCTITVLPLKSSCINISLEGALHHLDNVFWALVLVEKGKIFCDGRYQDRYKTDLIKHHPLFLNVCLHVAVTFYELNSNGNSEVINVFRVKCGDELINGDEILL